MSFTRRFVLKGFSLGFIRYFEVDKGFKEVCEGHLTVTESLPLI